ncbi:MAG: DUF3142 domain-containing protein [Kofleriaceae bacterium]|nr:DUF3142 domain-containing protein [Kofleriaceae bacterium]
MGLGCAAERPTPGGAPAGAADPGRGRRSSPGLRHEAYVWQRAWTGAVREAVRGAPAELAGLRVQLLEVDRRGQLGRPGVDAAALAAARRPVTAVVRIDGARLPAGVSLAPALDAIAAWRRAGVLVVGLEIDHDCATAALPAYARLRSPPPAGWLRFGDGALPTWAGARPGPELAAAVDGAGGAAHAVRPRARGGEAAARARRARARAPPPRPGARCQRAHRATYAARVARRRARCRSWSRSPTSDVARSSARPFDRRDRRGLVPVAGRAGDHAAPPSTVLLP